jgi:hypothetical protein
MSHAPVPGRAIREEFDHVRDIVKDIDSESTLDDHISALHRLAPRAGSDPVQLEKTVEVVKERITELVGETSVAEAPTLTGPKKEWDKFDNAGLRNLFQPLLVGTLDGPNDQRASVGAVGATAPVPVIVSC